MRDLVIAHLDWRRHPDAPEGSGARFVFRKGANERTRRAMLRALRDHLAELDARGELEDDVGAGGGEPSSATSGDGESDRQPPPARAPTEADCTCEPAVGRGAHRVEGEIDRHCPVHGEAQAALATEGA